MTKRRTATDAEIEKQKRSQRIRFRVARRKAERERLVNLLDAALMANGCTGAVSEKLDRVTITLTADAARSLATILRRRAMS